MASKKTETAGTGSNSRSGNTGTTAAKRKLDKTLKNKAANGESKRLPKDTQERGKGRRKGEPVVAPKRLSGRVKEYVEEHFDDILNAVIVSAHQGNASVARRLFDYCTAAGNEQDVEIPPGAKGLSLGDLFGADFDWKSLQQNDQTAAGAPAEAGVDVGFGGREPE